MNINTEHNGQPSLQTAQPTDPRVRGSNSASTTSIDETCRDYVWGICSKGAHCKYRHVLNLENMKKIIKFCHNFQNRSGCTGQMCTYLHTTDTEEKLFLTSGVIPKILRERYAAANMLYNDCISQPPPPPPPLPQANALQAAGTQQPPPLPAPLPSLLAPPPPPPLPTVTTTPVLTTPPVFTGIHQTNNSTPMAFPPVPDPLSTIKFDASKPPPPLPPGRNGNIKRSVEPAEAGPSKRRKLEVGPTVCEACIQRELRIEVFRKEIERLECEKECQTFLLHKKNEAFANGKLLLKSAVSPDLFHIMDAYIEQASSPLEQVNDVMSHISQMNSLVSGPSSSTSLQNQIMNIMDLARNIVEGPRPNAFANNPEWTKQSFLEMFRNVNNNSQKQNSIPPAHLPGPSRTQNAVDPQKTFTQKRQSVAQPIGVVQTRTRPSLHAQQIPSAPVQNVAQQPNLMYGQTVSNLQNAVQTPNSLHSRPLQHQNSRPIHPQPALSNYETMSGQYATAALPPPRPYYPAYTGASNNGATGYRPVRGVSGVSGTPVVTTSASGTPTQFATYIQRYPHHP